jgi:hypothetical protein
MSPEFCTLFDRRYLPRGLALHASLRSVEPRAHLRVFCMDDHTHDLLKKLDLGGITPIPLSDLERHDPQLAAVKSDRSQIEYCWTATPSIARYCLDREPTLTAITYVDADIFFYSSPQPLFDELGDDSTQIVPHRFAPEKRQQDEAANGVYNVEWLTFKRDQRGLEALDWWRDRCIEWCYDRIEDGKLGDQKYLDDWPERFRGVSVLQHHGGGLAPWNVANYRLSERDGHPWVDDEPVVFFHFHSLKLFQRSTRLASSRLLPGVRAESSGTLLWTSWYPRTSTEDRLLWEPYIDAIVEAIHLARSVDPSFAEGFVGYRELALQSVRRTVGGAYHAAGRLGRRRPGQLSG